MATTFLLREKLRRCDALVLVARKTGPQQYTGEVERVYSRRFQGPNPYDGSFSFVGTPDHWGSKTLDDGERALVFVSYLSNSQRYYQLHWRGHFSLCDIAGTLHAVAHWRLLDEGDRGRWGPDYLRDSAFLADAAKPWQVALPFNLLERHLLEEIEQIEHVDGGSHGA